MPHWHRSSPRRSTRGEQPSGGRSRSLLLSLALTCRQSTCISGSLFPADVSSRGSLVQRMCRLAWKVGLRLGEASLPRRSPALGCWGVIRSISLLRIIRSERIYSLLCWCAQEQTPMIRLIGMQQPCRHSSSPTEGQPCRGSVRCTSRGDGSCGFHEWLRVARARA